jgi:uncharacterized phage protein (TIGR01671 family)
MKREIKFRAWDKSELFLMPWDDMYNDSSLFMPVINNEDDNFILEQFTGLTDKNGKEIYEGDILLWSDRNGKIKKWVVDFVCGGFCAKVNGKGGSWQLSILTAMSFDTDPCEIIGNIHENPELLES